MTGHSCGFPTAQWLALTVQPTREGFRVVVRGSVDLSNAWQLEETLARVGDLVDTGTVVVDLRHAAFVALAGVRVIAKAAVGLEQQHVRLHITHASPLIRNVFSLLGGARFLTGEEPRRV